MPASPSKIDDIEILDVIDTEQPTVETHRTDSRVRVQIVDEEALVHHEFQTADSTPLDTAADGRLYRPRH